MPPFQKIFEAFSAIADARVTMSPQQAVVISSNKKKTYHVTWNEQIYASNDNATYWQSYPGYPVIAVLLLQGRLPMNEALIMMCAHINWNDINKQYKADYDKALQHVLSELGSPERTKALEAYAREVYEALGKVEITVKRLHRR